MATEIYAEGGTDVAITVTPGGGGILKVLAGDEVLYDKAAEDGRFPDLPRVKEIRAEIQRRLEA